MNFEFGQYSFRVTQSIPVTTPNRHVALAALKVHESYRILGQIGWGHLLTGARNSVQHPDKDVRAAIQSNVNEMIEGLGILYCFSIWDHFFPGSKMKHCIDGRKTKILDRVEKVWMTEDEELRFLAYKHVRHSIAHGFDGRRARNNRKQFERVMGGRNRLAGVEWDQERDTVHVSGGAAIGCFQYLEHVSGQVAAKAMNKRSPRT